MRCTRHVAGWLFVVLLVVSLGAIWFLTEQSATDTSMLSESVAVAIDTAIAGDEAATGVATSGIEAGERSDGSSADAMDESYGNAGQGHSTEGVSGGEGAAPGDGPAASENEGTAGGVAAAANDLFASLRAFAKTALAGLAQWTANNIRRVAHTVEFAFVGLFASASAVCLLPWNFRSWRAKIPVIAFCAVCSLIDQTHKLFVPGRHFDPVDLAFDAAGYLVACALVFAAAGTVVAVKARRCGRQRSS